MKQIIFILLFSASAFSAQAQANQNIYRYNYTATAAAGDIHVQELPVPLFSLWTLGGSFRVTNNGSDTDNFLVIVYGTSDPTLTATIGDAGLWQEIKQIPVIGVAAGGTAYAHFRAANEMFYLGHTRLMIQFTGGDDYPGQISANLVLKKQ